MIFICIYLQPRDTLATIEGFALRDFKRRKPFDSLLPIMHVALVFFSTEKTGRMMFVDEEGFLRGVRTLLN